MWERSDAHWHASFNMWMNLIGDWTLTCLISDPDVEAADRHREHATNIDQKSSKNRPRNSNKCVFDLKLLKKHNLCQCWSDCKKNAICINIKVMTKTKLRIMSCLKRGQETIVIYMFVEHATNIALQFVSFSQWCHKLVKKQVDFLLNDCQCCLVR